MEKQQVECNTLRYPTQRKETGKHKFSNSFNQNSILWEVSGMYMKGNEKLYGVKR
jgi:hypothetical protein